MPLSLEGRVLHAKFRFIRQIGKGGMASVWAAMNTLVERPVAIKLIRAEAGSDEDTVARFRAEAKAAGRIGHPNVCEILDYGVGPRGPYIVMERLRGQSLGELIHYETRLDPAIAVALVRQALLGLEAAHTRNIIHRDLKPENIFVHQPETGPPVVKLMDFGVSKLLDGSSSVRTQHGALLGTPEYMSPEQFKGAATADVRTDIWAMGAILYKALTGKTAFAGPSVAATLLMVTTDPPEPIPDLVRGVPKELVEIVERCLNKDPTERFESAAELCDALMPFDIDTLAGLVVWDPEDEEPEISSPTLVADEISSVSKRSHSRPLPAAQRDTEQATTQQRRTSPRGWARPEFRAWGVIIVVTLAVVSVLYMLASDPEHERRHDAVAADDSDPPDSEPRSAASHVPTAEETVDAATAAPSDPPPSDEATATPTEDLATGATGAAEPTDAPPEAPDPTAADPELVEPAPAEPEPEPAAPDPAAPDPAATKAAPAKTEPKPAEPGLPPTTPPGTIRVGPYLTLKKPGPSGDHGEARAYCRNLGTHAFVGVTEWKLANPTVAKKVAGVVKKGRYWTSALWQGKAKTMAAPSKAMKSRDAKRSGPRALCVARWP